MSKLDSFVTGESLPWTVSARFMTEFHALAQPDVGGLRKTAGLATMRLAHLLHKMAQVPSDVELAPDEIAALQDPEMARALELQELEAERASLYEAMQQLQARNEEAEASLAMAQQQAEVQAQQVQQTQLMLQQSEAARQAMTMQAIQAQDSAMAEVMNQQQHRQELMQAADQLAQQLKQVAAYSPAERQQIEAQQASTIQALQADAQAQMEGVSQAQPPQQQPAQAAAPVATSKVQKELNQAERAEQGAAVQKRQAEEAMQREQEQQGGAPVKQGSLKEALLGKEAGWKGHLAMIGAGGAAGAGIELGRRIAHQKRYGKDVPNSRELKLIGDIQEQALRAQREPSYKEEERLADLKHMLRTERAGREHPAGAVLGGAKKGLLAGAVLGVPTLELGGAVLKALRKGK
jgi:hypothetical protein